MNKEELLEMINSTINENGAGMITGKTLNLALTEIVNAMGSGSGGGLMIHFIPGEFMSRNLSVFDAAGLAKFEECRAHNIEVYNTLKDCNVNHTPVPGPIYFDTTFFEWEFNGRENSVRGGSPIGWRSMRNSSGELVFEIQPGEYSSTASFITNVYLFPDGWLWEASSGANNQPS